MGGLPNHEKTITAHSHLLDITIAILFSFFGATLARSTSYLNIATMPSATCLLEKDACHLQLMQRLEKRTQTILHSGTPVRGSLSNVTRRPTSSCWKRNSGE